MNLQKRDCSIKIEFCNIEAGWLDAKIKFNDKEIKVISSYIGPSIEVLLEAIYMIHPNSSYHDNSKYVKYTEIKGMAEGQEVDWNVPYKAEFYWDEEGSYVDWYFEHTPTLENEFDLNVKIIASRRDTKEIKFTVSYKEFCYALAKAFTDMLKKYGIFGYHHSWYGGDVNFRQLLFIKAIALDADDMINTNIDDKYSVFSDLNKELELLMFDM